MKRTENMLIVRQVAKDAGIEKAAREKSLACFGYLRKKFPEETSMKAWFETYASSVDFYLKDAYVEKNDFERNEDRKRACFDALGHVYFSTVVYDDVMRPGTNRYWKALAAFYVLAMFVPGRHLGFTVAGSSIDPYYLTVFGGTAASAGKYGFGINVLKAAPAPVKYFFKDVIRGKQPND